VEERTGASAETARLVARLGQGSIGRALAFLPGDDGTSHVEALRTTARGWLEAALAPSATARYAAAHEQRPAGARGAFSDTLDFLALWLRDLAAVAAGAEAEVVDVDALDRLRALARSVRAEQVPAAIQRVEEAREGGRINANPQLTLATLLDDLADSLRR
jgi:hypothetical protein